MNPTSVRDMPRVGLKADDAENTALAAARDQSVVQNPRIETDGIGAVYVATQTPRGPILPPWGTRQREYALRMWYRHEYSTLLQGAFMGLVKKWASTEWNITGGKILANRFQRLFQNAEFGLGWGNFISRVMLDYLRFDGGAYIEIIAPGDPRGEPTGAVTGLAHLDSYSCWPTGDPEFPVVYWSRLGKYNLLHRSRVIHLVDMPDGDHLNPGYGLCALSRAIAVVERELHMQHYIVLNLNDVPSSGAVIANNLSEESVNAAYGRLRDQQTRDEIPAWGNVVWFRSLNPQFPASLTNFTFSRPPEKFDWNTYVQIDVDMLALAIGVDRQDLWPLNTRSMGSGAQSEILAEKARGKTFGNGLIELERAFNTRVLPEALEFNFEIDDPQQDAQNAATFKAWADGITSAGAHLSNDEGRRLLANQVKAVEDVVIDEAGQMVVLPGIDPRPLAGDQIGALTDPALPPTTVQAATPAGTPITATDSAPNASTTATKGLETDEQRRWFFANLAEVDARGLPKLQEGLTYGHGVHPHELKKGDQVYFPDRGKGGRAHSGTVGRVNASTVRYVTSDYPSVTRNPDTGATDPDTHQQTFTEPHRNLRGGFVRRGSTVHPILNQYGEVEHSAQKDFDATREAFVANVADLIHGSVDEDVNRRRAGIVMRGLLNSAGKQARKDGLADGGVTGALSDADLTAHAAWLADQSGYVADFLSGVYKNGLTDVEINAHAQMWANKSLQSAYYEGLQSADANGMYQFVGDDGKESCATCKSLKGTKMRLSEWTEKALRPGVDGDSFECKGYQCQHRLQRVVASEQ